MLRNGLINTYVGDKEYEGEEWGNNFYLHFDPNSLSTDFLSQIVSHEWYIDMIDRGNVIVLVFKFPYSSSIKDIRSWKRNAKKLVVDPFLRGEYSKIDRAYVIKNFPRLHKRLVKGVVSETMNLDWQILWKSPYLKNYWEELLDVEIESAAEVWSKPEKEKEVYELPRTN